MIVHRTLGPRLISPALALFLATALCSCTVGPNYQRPALEVPTAYKLAPTEATTTAEVPVTWWTLFNDARLTELAQQALDANQDIRAAMARVESARAAARSAQGSFFPTLELNPSAQRSRSRSTGNTSNSYSLPLDLNYEIDVWGRLRRQYEFFRESERASDADLAFVRQTVVAEVAQAYFNSLFFDSQITLLEKAQELYKRQLDLTDTKVRAGLALQTDLLQARTQLDTATNQLIDVRRSRAKQEHAIAVLLGRPASNYTLPPGSLALAIPTVPAGLPAALLLRRPDVRAAEHQLAAANAEIGVAQGAFYPSFSLTGLAGFQSTDIARLTDWQNRVWSLGAGLTQPIFEGGKLRAALAQARANYELSVATYRTSVLNAFQDTEDQLSELHFLADKAVSLDETLVSAREYFRLTELQYKQGLITYLQVIDANQTLLNNEISQVQTHSQRLSATVLLIRAIGGGWTETPPPSK